MKINRRYIRILRYSIQWSIFVFILYVGFRFYLFVKHFETGSAELVERPSSIEGFLPIGALMSLKVWLMQGIIDSVHPAALVILTAALVISLALKKSFCGWICPVGPFSELSYKTYRVLFGKNLVIPRYIDYGIRSLKYVFLGFFLYVILIRMRSADLISFTAEPYWKISDVKLLKFFTEMSATTAAVLWSLFFLSLLYKNFWCRYLCPYGALLGVLGLLSPFTIRREERHCTHCHKCTEHCPHLLPVEEKDRIRSAECNGCLTCVSVCPSRGALDVSLPGGIVIPPLVYIALIIVIFFGLTHYAQFAGYWETGVTYKDYMHLIPQQENFTHP